MEFLLEETRRRPADFTPWVLLVEARLASGDGAGAQQAARAASAALTNPAERQFLLARLAEVSGRTDEATRVYRELAAMPQLDASLLDRVRAALRRATSSPD
jgi:hypothetical protein